MGIKLVQGWYYLGSQLGYCDLKSYQPSRVFDTHVHIYKTHACIAVQQPLAHTLQQQ
jgi:hypothetical protein